MLAALTLLGCPGALAADTAALSATFSTAALQSRSTGAAQWTILAHVESPGVSNVVVEVTPAGATAPAASESWGDLPKGGHDRLVKAPAWREGAKLNVQLKWAGGARQYQEVALPAPKTWTIYLVQHTHTDIGYTRPQTEILPEHLRYIDFALDYCDLTDGYPDDARFRWTCEISWALREYLARRPETQLRRLKQRVQEGRIEPTAMFLNMSEIASEASLAASLQPLRSLKDFFGTPVVSALQNDVNGAGWCLVDYFDSLGVKYLTMGINKTRSLLPFDRPTTFWWESPSGKRTLAFRADHYMTANFWKINEGKVEPFGLELAKYLHGLEASKYPFDRIGVQFSGYFTDNSPPSTIGSDVVKAWNEQYTSPHLRLATVGEFPAWVAQNHAAELPVLRQAWPDWWTDGFGSAARETAASRQTHVTQESTDALLAVASAIGTPLPSGTRERAARVHENLLFYDEHTYGAAESISEPMAANSMVQWGEKGAYAWTAVKESALLREEAMGLLQNRLPRGPVPTITVFNTLGWARSGLVELFADHQVIPREHEPRLVDAVTGEALPVQALSHRAEGTYWAIWVKDVPALGYRTLKVEPGTKPLPANPEKAPESLENAHYAVKLAVDRGAVLSLVDKATGAELVDDAAPWALGQFFYETLSGGRDMVPDRFKRFPMTGVKLQPGAAGPIWQSVILTGTLPGGATNGASVEVRLYHPEKRIEFHYGLRKLPVNDPEAVYVAFPFKLAGGKFLYEAQGGAVVPGVDQIPGSASDWQTFQNFVAVQGTGQQIVWGSDAMPLVQLGGLNLGKWQPIAKPETAHVYSWVMNNYWFTNFRANQEGDHRWFYYLTSQTGASRTEAARFGWQSRVPLLSRVFPPQPGEPPSGRLPASGSLLSIANPDLALVHFRPALAGRGVVFHLRELSGKGLVLRPDDVTCPLEIEEAEEVSVLDEPLAKVSGEVAFRPFETKLIRVVFKQP